MNNSTGQKGISCYREEVESLNQDFLKSLQWAVQKGPTDCLAPLAMDYLQFMYNILKNQPKNNKGDHGSVDFITVAKFFQDMKDNFNCTTSNGKPSNQVPLSLSSSTIPSSSSSSFAYSSPFSSSSSSTISTFGSPVVQNNFSKSFTTTTTTNNNSGNNPPTSATTTSTPITLIPTTTTFSFGQNQQQLQNKNGINASPSIPNTLSFGSSSTNSSSLTTSIGQKQQPPPPSSSLFTFGTSSTSSIPTSSSAQPLSSSTFSFQGIKPPVSTMVNGTKDDSDDDAEPPKPEFTPVLENDALYTKRVKLFEMVDKTYKDKGVGNLFIKQLSGGKSQLVVRADNSLGTILLNVVLNSAIALKLNPPNNIITTFPGTDKSSTFIIRVKTKDEADELLQTLEKHKN